MRILSVSLFCVVLLLISSLKCLTKIKFMKTLKAFVTLLAALCIVFTSVASDRAIDEGKAKTEKFCLCPELDNQIVSADVVVLASDREYKSESVSVEGFSPIGMQAFTYADWYRMRWDMRTSKITSNYLSIDSGNLTGAVLLERPAWQDRIFC